MSKYTKIETLEELFIILRQGTKVYNENWEDREYLKYFPNTGVMDENDDEVNISVLMNNWNEGDFYYEN